MGSGGSAWSEAPGEMQLLAHARRAGRGAAFAMGAASRSGAPSRGLPSLAALLARWCAQARRRSCCFFGGACPSVVRASCPHFSEAGGEVVQAWCRAGLGGAANRRGRRCQAFHFARTRREGGEALRAWCRAGLGGAANRRGRRCQAFHFARTRRVGRPGQLVLLCPGPRVAAKCNSWHTRAARGAARLVRSVTALRSSRAIG